MSTNKDWIKIETRKPTKEDYPVWLAMTHDGGAVQGVYHIVNDFSNCTHWRSAKAEVPAPPAPEPTQREEDEKALREYLDQGIPPNANRYWPPETVWRSALAYRDAQNAKDVEQFSTGPVLSHIPMGAIKSLRRRCGLDK